MGCCRVPNEMARPGMTLRALPMGRAKSFSDLGNSAIRLHGVVYNRESAGCRKTGIHQQLLSLSNVLLPILLTLANHGYLPHLNP
jgi:hypothetical protein